MAFVTTRNLTKSYGEVHALKGVSLQVEKGEIFGIIGADGAGKTTLFRLLATLLLPDSGDATIDGSDVVDNYKQIRRDIGYMPGRFSLYQDMTVRENLEFFASVFKTTVKEQYDLIAPIYMQIEPFNNRRSGKLSGGMKQKLALCCALIHKPKLLLLDEPTTGVDPVSRKEFWDMLKHLKTVGITIIVSTPYMDEANMCNRVALIREGQFLKVDTPKAIIADFGEKLYASSADNMHSLLKDIRKFETVKQCYTYGTTHHFTCNGELNTVELKKFLEEKGHINIDINLVTPTIEDCYMHL